MTPHDAFNRTLRYRNSKSVGAGLRESIAKHLKDSGHDMDDLEPYEEAFWDFYKEINPNSNDLFFGKNGTVVLFDIYKAVVKEARKQPRDVLVKRAGLRLLKLFSFESSYSSKPAYLKIAEDNYLGNNDGVAAVKQVYEKAQEHFSRKLGSVSDVNAL